MIALESVTFRWRPDRPLVLDIETLAVRAGERLFVRGPSGSGKTTLLNLIAGITAPSGGTVRVLDRDLGIAGGAARDRFRADHVGIVFQQFNLLPFLSMRDNVLLPCRFSAHRRQRVAGALPDEADRLLTRMGLERRDVPVGDLSVGQQQRVAVARALIGRPDLLIADEPTSALDRDSRDAFLALLFEEAAASGATLLFVSHDPALAAGFDRVIDLPTLNRATVMVPA